MFGRKDDFRQNHRSIFSRQQQKYLNTRENRLLMSASNSQSISSHKRISNFHGSMLNMELTVRKLRDSITPKKNTEHPRFFSPKASLVAQNFTGNKDHFRASDQTRTQTNSYSKDQSLQFIKKVQQVSPLVFIRGEIQIKLMPSFSSVSNNRIQILIPKIVNFSQNNFPPSSLFLYILGTDIPAEKQQLNLKEGDFQIVIKTPIFRKINQQSSERNISLETSWIINENFGRVNFVIVLKDQRKNKILYWRNYLDPQQLVNKIKRKIEVQQKLQFIL